MMKDDEDDDGRCVTPLCLANLHGTLAPLRPGPSYLLGSSPTDRRPAWGPATGRFTSRLLSSRISASYLPPLSSSAEIWPGTSLTPLCMTRPLTPAATRPRALPAWLTAPCCCHLVPSLSTRYSWWRRPPQKNHLLGAAAFYLLRLYFVWEELAGHHACPSCLALSWKAPCRVPDPQSCTRASCLVLVYYIYLDIQQWKLDKKSQTQDFMGPSGVSFLFTMSTEEASLAEIWTLDLNPWFED